MGYEIFGRKAGRVAGFYKASTELRNDLLNNRKFYRVKTEYLKPLQTGTFVEEGYGAAMAFFSALRNTDHKGETP